MKMVLLLSIRLGYMSFKVFLFDNIVGNMFGGIFVCVMGLRSLWMMMFDLLGLG